MSQLKVNSIIPIGGVPSGSAGGGIIQIAQGTTSSAAETSGSTYQDTNLSASIVPVAANSKILVQYHQHFQIGASGTSHGAGIQLLRGSTVIKEGRPSDSTGPYTYYFATLGATVNFYFYADCIFLDSPSYSVGDTLTYKTQMRVYNTSNGTQIRAQTTDDGNATAPTSYMYLMEVAT
tara:strand:+ start:1534 stop:2067 length:534 start_codon:yes stop_codon:yes gene_type:complete